MTKCKHDKKVKIIKNGIWKGASFLNCFDCGIEGYAKVIKKSFGFDIYIAKNNDRKR